MNDSVLTSRSSDISFEFTKSDAILPVEALDANANNGISNQSEQAEEEIVLVNNETVEKISQRLAAFALLYDIPFCYLMPGESLLPPNSLRFFYLDQNWIFSLLDGALSPGRIAEIDIEHDRKLAHKAYAQAMREAEKIRRILQGRDLLPTVQGSSDDDFKPEACTGFLLRSPLVTGWRGLEINAYDKDEVPLQALRIETLAHDVLLALFLGEVDYLVISEPPEGLHYGMNTDYNGFIAGLRSFKNGKMDGKTTFNISERGNRVINFTETADNIAALSVEAGERIKMDSAKMALQLTRTANMLTVKVKGDSK